MFEKSIQVSGLTHPIFFGREVTEKDVRDLAKLVELGREDMRNSIKKLLELK